MVFCGGGDAPVQRVRVFTLVHGSERPAFRLQLVCLHLASLSAIGCLGTAWANLRISRRLVKHAPSSPASCLPGQVCGGGVEMLILQGCDVTGEPGTGDVHTRACPVCFLIRVWRPGGCSG